MFRSIVGFAIFALLVWLGLRLVFAVLGGLLSLVMTVLWLALIGFLFYVVLRVVSPGTARRVKEMISGKGDTAA